jgi:hypothetical protein
MGKGGVPYNMKPFFCPNLCPLSLTLAQLDALSPENIDSSCTNTENFPHLVFIL